MPIAVPPDGVEVAAPPSFASRARRGVGLGHAGNAVDESRRVSPAIDREPGAVDDLVDRRRGRLRARR